MGTKVNQTWGHHLVPPTALITTSCSGKGSASCSVNRKLAQAPKGPLWDWMTIGLFKPLGVLG